MEQLLYSGSERLVKELGLKPIVAGSLCSAGVHPRVMGIGPVAAIPKVLRQVNMNLVRSYSLN
jgi:acetyl-CoA acyltransferase